MLLVSFNVHTCVGDQEWLITRANCGNHGNCARGKGGPQKAHFLLLPAGGAGALPLAVPPAAFAAAGWAASSSSPCPDAASSPSASPPPSPQPSPQLSQPPSAAAAAATTAAARASFLAVSRSMISFLVSVGADGAGQRWG